MLARPKADPLSATALNLGTCLANQNAGSGASCEPGTTGFDRDKHGTAQNPDIKSARPAARSGFIGGELFSLPDGCA